MGILTREMESKAISSLHPGFYTETLYLNWGPIDVVVTDKTGKQHRLPKWPKPGTPNPHVTIITRSCCGSRVQMTKTGPVDVAIPGKEYTINYNEFSSYPTRVDELGVIVSTEEMALVARDMFLESGYRYSDETYSDLTTVDPRFVFEVHDPFNRWENLYVNVLGQTITLRCGHKGQIIPDLDESTIAQYNSECTLSCFLRYPSNYVQAEREVVPVFEINLSGLDRKEPYRLPTGDVICVASSLEDLQDVLARKHVGSASPNFAALGMVSKDIHDQQVNALTSKIDQEKRTAADQLRSMRAKSDADMAALRAEMAASKRENENLKQQLEYFNTLHKAMVERADREEKFVQQREKTREAEIDASQKSFDRTTTLLKVGGTLAAGVLTFALTMLAKSKK